MTVTCRGFKAMPLPNGEIRLDIENPQADALSDKLTMGEIANELKQSVKSVDRLSRRKRNPLPLHRSPGARPFGLRFEINQWLRNQDRSPIFAGRVQRTQ